MGEQFNYGPAASQIEDASTSSHGLMSAADKVKLDGIESQANKTTVSDSLSDTSTTNALSAAQGKVLNDKIGAVPAGETVEGQISSLNSKIPNPVNTSSGFNRSEIFGSSNSNIMIVRGYIDSGSSDYLQLVLLGNSKEARLVRSNNGTETTLYELALNSDLTNYINAATQNLVYGNATMELINGTGTVRNTPGVAYNDQYVAITGIARFSGFSRTGSHPGIKITLPVNVAAINRYDALMTTASGMEFATLHTYGNNIVSVTISESFSNYNSGYMTIVFPNIVLRRA